MREGRESLTANTEVVSTYCIAFDSVVDTSFPINQDYIPRLHIQNLEYNPFQWEWFWHKYEVTLALPSIYININNFWDQDEVYVFMECYKIKEMYVCTYHLPTTKNDNFCEFYHKLYTCWALRYHYALKVSLSWYITFTLYDTSHIAV